MNGFIKSLKGFGWVIILTLVCSFVTISNSKPGTEAPESTYNPQLTYSTLQLNNFGLNKHVFELAVKGWGKLKSEGKVSKDIVSICDFSQSSNNNRLYIIDLAQNKLLFNTLVAHGKNSGDEFASQFSNQPSSYQSSLGFYTTSETYMGKHGLSLVLNGIEPNFNNNAKERAIVMHGAEYVHENFSSQWGRIGRSFGCPAVPSELNEKIVAAIKDGSCLFIYYPDQTYLSSSKLLN